MRSISANFIQIGQFTVAGSVLLNIAMVPVQAANTKNQLIGNAQQELGQSNGSVLVASTLAVLPETIKLVQDFEGFRSYAYLDTSGLPVIGYGQTRINGRTVRMGQRISQGQAQTELAKELFHIQKLVKAHVKVDLNPYQLGALTSLVFNAGTRVLKTSTLIRKLNAGDYAGASREFVRWNKANRGGKLVVFPGLTKRRLAEQSLFLTPYERVISSQ